MALIHTTKGDITLRPAGEADLVAYRELRLEALKNHPTAFGADYETAAAQTDQQWRARLLPNDDAMILLADAGDQLAGMTGISRHSNPKERHYGYLTSVYLRPAWRGTGVADALIVACIDWAQERGLRTVRLGVNVTNGSAIRCYTRCGFQAYGVEPELLLVDGMYHDELLMMRRLKS